MSTVQLVEHERRERIHKCHSQICPAIVGLRNGRSVVDADWQGFVGLVKTAIFRVRVDWDALQNFCVWDSGYCSGYCWSGVDDNFWVGIVDTRMILFGK